MSKPARAPGSRKTQESEETSSPPAAPQPEAEAESTPERQRRKAAPRTRRKPARPRPAGQRKRQFASFLKDATDGLRFELAANAEAEEQPFATLSESGRYSRVLLGRIVSPGGTILRDVAVKIQRDDYAEEPFHHVGGRHRATNPAIDNLWRREYESLSAFAEGVTGVVQLLDLFFDERGFRPIPPVIHCREKDVYFHALCPQCGGRLEDCRDERLIQALKTELEDISKTEPILESYQESTRRALYCSSCSAAAESVSDQRLYVRAWTRPEHRERARGLVQDRNQLWIAYRDAMAEQTLSGDDVPCVDCDLRSSCYAGEEDEADVLTRLQPLSFYEFYALPLECLHLQYHYATQIIGGRSFADLRARLERTHDHSTGQAYLLERAEPALSHEQSRLTIYTKSMPEQYALETLKLKLALYRDVCHGLARIHADSKSPHLDLKPQNIMVRVGGARRETPALWTLSGHIIDLASAKPYFHGDEGSDSFIFEPPTNLHENYTSPVMLNHENFGFRRQGTLEITDVSATDRDFWIVSARLRDESLNSRDYSAKDAIAVSFQRVSRVLENVRLVFQLDGDQPKTNELRLKSSPAGVSEPQAERLMRFQAEGIVISDLDYWRYKCFHIPCDLYSMGVLLLQTLLETEVVEDESRPDSPPRGQSISHFLPRAHTLIKTLEDEGLEGEAAKDRIVQTLREVEDRWRNHGAKERSREVPGWCSKAHLFYRPDNENWQLADTIPDDLWQEAMLIAFRLMTNIEGFSYCADNSDFELGDPSSRILRALARLEVVIDQVHARLFGLQGLARPVHQALDHLIGEEKLHQPDAFESLPEQDRMKLLSFVGKIAERVMQAGSNPGDSLQQVASQIERTIESGIQQLPAEQHLAFASSLRERFPYLTTSAKAENRALNEEIEQLRAQVAKLLGVASTDAIDERRMTELGAVAEVCARLRDHIAATPQDVRSLRLAKQRKRIPPPQNSPLDETISQWAQGKDFELVPAVERLLSENGQVAARLMVAYRHAIDHGVSRLRDAVLDAYDEAVSQRGALPPRQRFFDALRRSLEGVFAPRDEVTREPIDLEDLFFWDGFERGFEGKD